MAEVFAAADIGSNTARVLISRFSRGSLERLDTLGDWLGLGEAVSQKGAIPLEYEQRLIYDVKRFVSLARGYHARSLYVFGTESMRSAKNCNEVIERVERETGIRIDLIDGRREAELSWRGAQIDSFEKSRTLFVEIGGGSIQVAVCKGEAMLREESLPLGTARLASQVGLIYPCKKLHIVQLRQKVEQLESVCRFFDTVDRIVSSGGVSRTIVNALHPDGERLLRLKELEYLSWAIARLSTAQASARFHVKPKRAMTIVPGAIALIGLMRLFDKKEILVSQYGIREGASLEMFEGRIRGCCL